MSGYQRRVGHSSPGKALEESLKKQNKTKKPNFIFPGRLSAVFRNS